MGAESCEDNLEGLKGACTEAYLGGSAATCCAFLSRRVSQACIQGGAYDALLATSLGKALLAIQGSCPQEPAGAGESSGAETLSVPEWWSVGLCRDGTAEVVWGPGNATHPSGNNGSSLELAVERWVDGALARAQQEEWTYLSLSPAVVGKYVDEGASCSSRRVSYRLNFFLEGRLVATAATQAQVEDAEARLFVWPWPEAEGEGDDATSEAPCGAPDRPCGGLAPALEVVASRAAAAALASGESGRPPAPSLVLLPGVYRGPSNVGLRLENLTVSLVSAAGPEETILDCRGEGGSRSHGLELVRSNVAVGGVTISGCRASQGAAIRAVGGRLALTDLVLTDNEAVGDEILIAVGGAISLQEGAQADIAGTRVVGNRAAKYGAGIYVDGSRATVAGSDISANRLVSAGRGAGMAIFANSTVHVANSSIASNEAYFAGGVMLERSLLRLSDATVANNSANYGGGFVLVDALAVLERARVEGNRAEQYVQASHPSNSFSL